MDRIIYLDIVRIMSFDPLSIINIDVLTPALIMLIKAHSPKSCFGKYATIREQAEDIPSLLYTIRFS